MPSLAESHNFLSRFGSLLVRVAGCHHDVTRWPWYLIVATYRIGNHVYYWVWLRPDRLMWRIQQQEGHSEFLFLTKRFNMLLPYEGGCSLALLLYLYIVIELYNSGELLLLLLRRLSISDDRATDTMPPTPTSTIRCNFLLLAGHEGGKYSWELLILVCTCYAQ